MSLGEGGSWQQEWSIRAAMAKHRIQVLLTLLTTAGLMGFLDSLEELMLRIETGEREGTLAARAERAERAVLKRSNSVDGAMHLTGSPQRSKVGQFSSRDNLRLESPQNRFSGVVPVFPKLTTSVASLSSFPPFLHFFVSKRFPQYPSTCAYHLLHFRRPLVPHHNPGPPRPTAPFHLPPRGP